MGNFQKLRVWQLAKELAVKIYKVTSTPTFSKDYGLKDQIQRSSVSIPSNIAEGDELDTDKQSIRYFYISKGSAAELLTQLIIAQEIGYIDSETRDSLVNDCNIISVMLTKLIKARVINWHNCKTARLGTKIKIIILTFLRVYAIKLLSHCAIKS